MEPARLEFIFIKEFLAFYSALDNSHFLIKSLEICSIFTNFAWSLKCITSVFQTLIFSVKVCLEDFWRQQIFDELFGAVEEGLELGELGDFVRGPVLGFALHFLQTTVNGQFDSHCTIIMS